MGAYLSAPVTTKEVFEGGNAALSYGAAQRPDSDALDAMVDSLAAQEARRGTFIRRRVVDDSASGGVFINERNRRANAALARAWAPYNVEIRQNLERGTAL